MRQIRRPAILALIGAAVALVTVARLFPAAWPVGVVIRGTATGTAAGLMAVGLVLTYRLTGVVNFAYGAMGSSAASLGIVAYETLGWSWPLCVVLAIAGGVLVGLVADWVTRRFTTRPLLVQTVALIGLLQVLVGLQFVVAYLAGARTLVPPFTTVWSTANITMGTTLFDLNDLVAVAVAPVALGALSWFLYATDMGRAVRAIADNRERARLLAIPVGRVTRVVWVMAGIVAATVLVFNAPRQGLPANPFVSVGGVFLPALAAAVIARMRSLGVAFAAGVGIGIVQGVAAFNVRQASLGSMILVTVILIALLSRSWRQDRAQKGARGDLVGISRPLPAELAALPELRWGRRVLSVVVVTSVVLHPWMASTAQVHLSSGYLLMAMVALSLVVLVGWSGVVSLGQLAITGGGAVAAANLIARYNVDLFVVLGLSALAGAAIAFLLAGPALRVEGMFVAVTTVAFAAAMDQYVLNPTNFPEWLPSRIIRPVLFKRVELDATATYYLCLAALIATLAVVAALRRGRPARVLLAVRDNQRGAAAMTIAPVRVRLAAMVVSGGIAGLAGGLWAVLQEGVGSSMFPPQQSVTVFSMAVVGGLGSIHGALAGVAVVQLLTTTLGWLSPQAAQIAPLATGSLMLGILLIFPGGLAQAAESIRDRLAVRVGRRRGIDVAVGAAAGSREAATAVTPPELDSTAASPGNIELDLSGVTAHYGQLQVLFGIDMTVRRGDMLALLGTNGAGKSTVFRAVTGLLPASGGRISFREEPIDALGPEQIAARGIAMMPGGRGLFPTLAVRDNLRLACWMHRNDSDAVDEAMSESLSMFPRLAERLDQPAGNLSGGEQQQLSLAMTLITRPSVLLIDELSLGLAPTVVAELCEKVIEVNRAGTTVILVEQSVDVALRLAAEAVFLEKGAVRFRGPTADLHDRPDILRSVFIGGGTETAAPSMTPSEPRRRRVGLECRGVTKHFGGITAVDGVDLEVPPGQILGLIGHNGAGKTTLLDTISGFLVADGGRIGLGGRDITSDSVAARARLGLGRTFQEARLFGSLTVVDAVAIALDRHLTNRDWLASALAAPAAVDIEAATYRRAAELAASLGLEGYADTVIADLSTGTRRLVELACVVAADPDVVLLDEPSGGVAQKETEALGPLLLGLRDRTGCALIIIEHDMSLLSSICDELVALDLGRVISRGSPDDVLADPAVIASYLGADPSVGFRSGSRHADASPARPRRHRPLVAARPQQTDHRRPYDHC